MFKITIIIFNKCLKNLIFEKNALNEMLAYNVRNLARSGAPESPNIISVVVVSFDDYCCGVRSMLTVTLASFL